MSAEFRISLLYNAFDDDVEKAIRKIKRSEASGYGSSGRDHVWYRRRKEHAVALYRKLCVGLRSIARRKGYSFEFLVERFDERGSVDILSKEF